VLGANSWSKHSDKGSVGSPKNVNEDDRDLSPGDYPLQPSPYRLCFDHRIGAQHVMLLSLPVRVAKGKLAARETPTS